MSTYHKIKRVIDDFMKKFLKSRAEHLFPRLCPYVHHTSSMVLTSRSVYLHVYSTNFYCTVLGFVCNLLDLILYKYALTRAWEREP